MDRQSSDQIRKALYCMVGCRMHNMCHPLFAEEVMMESASKTASPTNGPIWKPRQGMDPLHSSCGPVSIKHGLGHEWRRWPVPERISENSKTPGFGARQVQSAGPGVLLERNRHTLGRFVASMRLKKYNRGLEDRGGTWIWGGLRL